MIAGRELDALVAEKVMGMKVYRRVGEDGPNPQYKEIEKVPEHCAVIYPPYSTDISAAWEVLLLDKFCCWAMKHDHESKLFSVEIEFNGNRYFAQADTAPHAICLAALKATKALEEMK